MDYEIQAGLAGREIHAGKRVMAGEKAVGFVPVKWGDWSR